MADPNVSSPTDQSSPQQALDDLTVLSNVQTQSLGDARLNVMRAVDSSGGGLGVLANVHEGVTLTAPTLQTGALQTGLDIGVDTSIASHTTLPVAEALPTSTGATVEVTSAPATFTAAPVFTATATATTTTTGTAPAAAAVFAAAPATLEAPAAHVHAAATAAAPAEAPVVTLPPPPVVTVNEISPTSANITHGATVGENGTIDFLPSADGLTPTVSGPLHGSIAYDSATGEYVYTPASDYIGTDTFVVSATDSYGRTVTDTVTVDVDGPVVTSNVGVTDYAGHSVTGTIQASEEGPNADPTTSLTYSLANGPGAEPAHGTVVVNADGTYTYTTAAGSPAGTDSFQVVVSDGHGGTVTQTVNVSDLANPTTTTEANATDGRGGSATATFTASDAAHDTMATTATALHGTVVVNADGTYTYTETGTGFTGTDTVTFTTDDGHGTTTVTTATVTVADDATITKDTTGGIGHGTITGAVTDSDQFGDSMSYALTDAPQHGTVSVATDGSYTYTPNADFTWSNGSSDTFTVQVADGHGDTTTQQVVVTEHDVAPVVTSLTGGSGVESITSAPTTVTGQVVATDGDNDTLHYAVVGDATHADGTLAVNADTGAFTFTAADPTFHGDDTFTVQVSDGHGGTVNQTVDIHVDAVPTVTASLGSPAVTETAGFTVTNDDVAGSAAYNNTYGYYIKDAQGNPESGTILFANTHAEVGATVNVQLPAGVDPNSVGFFIIPNGSSDNPGLKDGTPVTFEQVGGQWEVVNATTAAPLSGTGAGVLFDNAKLNGDGVVHVEDNSANAGNQDWEDLNGGGDRDYNDVNMNVHWNAAATTATVPLTITAAFPSAYGTDTHTVTVTLPQGTSLMEDGVAVTPTTAGGTTYTLDLSKADLSGLTVAVPNGYDGSLAVTVTASAEAGGTVAASSTPFTTQSLTLDLADSGPSTAPSQTLSGHEVALSGSVVAADSQGDALSYSLATNANGAAIGLQHGSVVLNTDGTFTYTPNSGFVGSDSFQVVVSDQHGGTTTQTVIVNETAPVQAELISGTGGHDLVGSGSFTEGAGADALSSTTSQATFTVTGDTGAVDTFKGGEAGNNQIHGTDWAGSTLVLDSTASNIQNIQSIDMGYGGTIQGTGTGNDTWNFSGIALTGRETVVAGPDNDVITGGTGTLNVAVGSATGTDTLSGGQGSLTVTLTGDSGHVDTITGGAAGNNQIHGTDWANSTLLLDSTASNIQNIQSIDMGYGGTIQGTGTGNDTWNFSGIALTGRETVVAGPDNDVITGGTGTLNVAVGKLTGTDTLSGGQGSLTVTLTGDSGHVDTITGGAAGNNQIHGTDWANSTLLLDSTASNIQNIQSIDMGYGGTIQGTGTGNDTWNFTGITLTGRETVVAGPDNDVITGGTGTLNVAVGSATGTDTLSGGQGSLTVTLTGDSGHVDTITGGAAGNNQIHGTDWANSTLLLDSTASNIQNIQSIDMGYGGTIQGTGTGNDTWNFSGIALTGRETVVAGPDNDVITGGTGTLNVAVGSATGTDTLSGGQGSLTVTLTGDSGHVDTITGGAAGNNQIHGTDWANSTLLLDNAADNISNIQSIDMGYGGTIQGTGTGNDTWNFSGIALTGRETVVAGPDNDVITGGTGTLNVAVGSATGTDTLSGGQGSLTVTLTGDSGHVDTITGGAAGNNQIHGTDWAGSTLLLDSTASNIQNIQSIDMGYGGTIQGTGTGNDTWNFSGIALTGRETVVAGPDNDVITGGTGTLNVAVGSATGTDTLSGGQGSLTVTLTGDSGHVDTITGGAAGNNQIHGTDWANSTLLLDNAADNISNIQSIDMGYGGTIQAGGTGNDTWNFTGITLTGRETVETGNGTNVITVGGGGEVIQGGSGSDTMIYDAGQGGAVNLNGEGGTNRLDINLTSAQDTAAVQQELQSYESFIANPAHAGQSFTFSALGNLTVTNFESVQVDVNGQQVFGPQPTFATLTAGSGTETLATATVGPDTVTGNVNHQIVHVDLINNTSETGGLLLSGFHAGDTITEGTNTWTAGSDGTITVSQSQYDGMVFGGAESQTFTVASTHGAVGAVGVEVLTAPASATSDSFAGGGTSGVYVQQLHIAAGASDLIGSDSMSYSVGGLPAGAALVDANGDALNASDLTDAQVQAGVYLTTPNDVAAGAFTLAVTAHLTEADGTVLSSPASSLTIDAAPYQAGAHVDFSTYANTTWGSGWVAEDIGADGQNGTGQEVSIVGFNENTGLIAGSYNDTLIGSSGDDYIGIGNANQTPVVTGFGHFQLGNGATEILDFTFNYDYDVPGTNTVMQNITIAAGTGNDIVWGPDGTTEFIAGTGTDTFHGGAGADTIMGSDGNLSVLVHDANNTIVAGGGADSITAGNGDNFITLGGGIDHVTVGAGDNLITLGGGVDSLTVGNGNNVITVGSGNDNITVGSGDNVITLGGGTDTVTVASGGHDTILASGGSDIINVGSGTILTVDHFDSSASSSSIVVNNAGQSGSSDLVFDFSAGHDTVTNVTGGSGTSWTDSLDLSHHASNILTVSVTDAGGTHTWTEAANAHGTIDFTASTQNGGLAEHNVTGTATVTEDGHTHTIDFSNIEKITY